MECNLQTTKIHKKNVRKKGRRREVRETIKERPQNRSTRGRKLFFQHLPYAKIIRMICKHFLAVTSLKKKSLQNEVNLSWCPKIEHQAKFEIHFSVT